MKIRSVLGSIAVAAMALSTAACHGKLDASMTIDDDATAKDAGLPTYPGAKPYKDSDDDKSSANLNFSTSQFGLSVVAMDLEVRDRPKQVAEFYRKALADYGTVLDCSQAGNGKSVDDQSDELTCNANEPGSHSAVYKVGTKNNQRIVAIKPHGEGTRFSLVHVNIRGG